MTKPTPPIERVRLGAVQAAIWKNTDKDGRSRYSATVERGYYDEKGEPHSTGSFGRDELLTLAKVADIANTRIHALLAADRAAEKVDTQPAAVAKDQVKSR